MFSPTPYHGIIPSSLSTLIGPAEIYPVPTCNTGEVACICANHRNANLEKQVWNQRAGREAWGRTPHGEKKKQRMSQNRQLAVTKDKAEELAEGGATKDGADCAEHVAKGANNVHKQLYAAIHCAAQDLVDVEEFREEASVAVTFQSK